MYAVVWIGMSADVRFATVVSDIVRQPTSAAIGNIFYFQEAPTPPGGLFIV
jgi:hypothetical protein